MYITLIILFLSAIFFMSGKVRSDLVALCALVLLIIFGILTPEEALTGFSNSVVIMIVRCGRCYLSDGIGKDDK